MKTIVVTRHPALVEYLQEQGYVDDNVSVIAHADVTDVAGKHVVGVLPLSLAVHAAAVTEVPMTIPAEKRGQELSLAEVRQFAGAPVTYLVKRAHPSAQLRQNAA